MNDMINSKEIQFVNSGRTPLDIILDAALDEFDQQYETQNNVSSTALTVLTPVSVAKQNGIGNLFFDHLPVVINEPILQALRGNVLSIPSRVDYKAVLATASVCKAWQQNPILIQERARANIRLPRQLNLRETNMEFRFRMHICGTGTNALIGPWAGLGMLNVTPEVRSLLSQDDETLWAHR